MNQRKCELSPRRWCPSAGPGSDYTRLIEMEGRSKEKRRKKREQGVVGWCPVCVNKLSSVNFDALQIKHRRRKFVLYQQNEALNRS